MVAERNAYYVHVNRGTGGDVSYNAQERASLECWGFLGWGRQQVGELRGQLAVLSRRE
jgi:hypothetical protein